MAIEQTKKIEEIIQVTYDKKAETVHIMADEPLVFRIKQKLERMQSEGLSSAEIKEIAIAAFGEEEILRVGREVGGLITYCGIKGVVDGRMHLSKSNGDYVIKINLLPSNLPTVDDIGLPLPILEEVSDFGGIFIFSGPTGSGKTTTMFSVLDYINKTKDCCICTSEYFKGYHLHSKKAFIQQREVGTDVPDMLEGIRASLLEGSDILMVGELRSYDEIKACLTAAMAGCYVITQLHADTPENAIQRLIDAADEEKDIFCRQLASVIKGVCVQKLLTKAESNQRVAVYGYWILNEQEKTRLSEGQSVFEIEKTDPKRYQPLKNTI